MGISDPENQIPISNGSSPNEESKSSPEQRRGEAMVKNLSEKSTQVVNQLGSKVGGKIDEALNATARGLDKTSTHIGKAASYIKEHNHERLVGDLGVAIRKNPTQSLIVGLLLGVFLGRLFRR